MELLRKMSPSRHPKFRSWHTALHTCRLGASARCRNVAGLDDDVGVVQIVLVGLQEFISLVADVELPIVAKEEVGPTSKRGLVACVVVWVDL